MSDLDWDDPNYVEGPVKPRDHAAMNEKYERSVRRDAEPRRYQDGGRRDDYGSEKRNNRDNSYGKGSRDDYGGRGARRGSFELSDFSETLSIAAEMIGKVIGRAGENIKRLQNDFNVRVKVDRGDQMVKIYGSIQRNVSDAMNAVRKQVSDSGKGRDRDPDDGGSRRPYGGSNYDFAPPPTAETPQSGDLTGTIDWDALNKASEKAAAARWAKCPPLTKDFYEESPEVADLSASEAEKIRKENNGTTVSHVFVAKEGETLPPIPNPVWKFEQCFAKYPDLLGEVMKQGFSKPSPIQSQAWPILLKGHDMIGIAQTGTGKTLAFLLPGMIHTEYQSIPRGKRGGPNVLILAPTRELALQIEMEVKKYTFRNMKAVCVYGGGDRRMQISDVERGAEIIICTPGRLNDLVQANVIDVSSITYLVLDEADRMLDMGFEPQIRKVLLDIRPDRQTIMTSATWPPGVRRLAQSYMKNPIQVCVGSLDLAATHSVKQIIQHLEDDAEKFRTIKSFVQNMTKTDKIIIFCGRKARADDLSSDLTLDGFNTQCIHGNRDQSDREQAIADIKSGVVRILVATDVASRGLDIEDISHVINYDFPRNIEEYVHRVGRTGRAGRKGTSISFITREDWGMAKELIDILTEAEQEVPEELHNMAKRFQAMKDRRAAEGQAFGGGGGGRSGGGGGRSGGGRFGGNRGGGGRDFGRFQH
ncbi:probable ATP-dependent RNA helicase DDX43 [Drosophila bipectinata]|uniref:probable ATP-dependent RNA helicase DDX43 n=1 Tax=Drosophila bipectinata TaxID=42026 RepID=UPI001C892911|nr:probable ATP-dependent RNA helicase DDX43 [Drosophila bipectinata]